MSTEPRSSTHPIWVGIALALTSAFAYSTSFLLTDAALDESTPPLTMTLLRFSSVVAVLAIWLAWRREFIPVFSANSLRASGLGLFHFLGNFVMMVALTLAPASITIVLFYTFPAMVLLLTCAIDRRLPGMAEIIAICLAVTGVALTTGIGQSGVPLAAVLLALAGAVCVSIMMLGTQRLMIGASSVAVTFSLALAATLTAAIATLVTGRFGLPTTATGWMLIAGVLTLYPIALTCAVLAIRMAGALTAALVLCTEPVITATLAVLFRGETLSPLQIAGMALVIVAVTGMQILRARGSA